MNSKNPRMNGGVFSSNKYDYATPSWLYNRLDEEFEFSLDPCAMPHNAKCDVFFTPNDDGLSQDWSEHGNVFMNPPYGRQIKHWVRKAYEEAQKGITVVALIPSRTDTRYWHNYVMKAKEIRFVKGRIQFGDTGDNAPFPSAVIVFEKGIHSPTVGAVRKGKEVEE